MTIAGKKNVLCKGAARILARTVRIQGGGRPDWKSLFRSEPVKPYQVLVAFNAKDELELKYSNEVANNIDKENVDGLNKKDLNKVEFFKIDEIIDCVSEDAIEFDNTLIVEVLKNHLREELVLQFHSEQEFRRTLFTYKYFKMRNRLTSSSSEMSDGSSSPSPSTKSKSSVDYSSSEAGSTPGHYTKVFEYSVNSAGVNNQYHAKNFDYSKGNSNSNGYSLKSLDYIPGNGSQNVQQSRNKIVKDPKETKVTNDKAKSYKPAYDLMQVTDNNGVTHMSVESKSDLGEIDGLIYTDVEYDSVDYASVEYGSGHVSSSEILDAPLKPQRRKHLLKRIKGRAPPPPSAQEAEVVRGQVVKVSMERIERMPPKEVQIFASRNMPPVTRPIIGSNGYESDREEWRSRSTFSSSAFHSLARPARRALAAYYRLSSSPASAQTIQPPPPLQLPRKQSPRNPRNLQMQEYQQIYTTPSPDYIVVSPIQDSKRNSLPHTYPQQDIKKNSKQEYKYGKMMFNPEYKMNSLGGSMNYLNISNRLYGLTDKLKELGTITAGQGNGNGRQSWAGKVDGKDLKEKGLLKPVIKKSLKVEGSKRPVVRTCSAEPPKKVTFSAFATVQVV